MKLRLDGVTKSFGSHRALDGVSLTVEGARSVVLIGPSGGGKSTLLRVLGGLETPDRGTVEVNGRALVFEEELLAGYRRTVGTVFQAFNLFPHLSALRNITLPLEKVHGLSPAEAVANARAHLARFRLEAHADKKPAELSGGQRQRVAIARALSIRPQLLLLDEPTSALDPEMTAEVLDVVAELRAEGRDLILVTHHMAFARRVADFAVVLAAGRVVEAAPCPQLFDTPGEGQTRDFLAKVLSY